MVQQVSDSSEQLLPQQEEKLRELTAQSWNLELVVSGVIMFAVLQGPDLLDSAFDYVQYNLMSQTNGFVGMLPSFAISVLKAGCYILFMAFLTNFVMRAFWVALVGLLAVYPAGIRYDRLPFTTAYSRQRTEATMGSLAQYILRLDQRCNIVFAVAFIFVLQLISIALFYLLLVVLHAGLRPILPAPYWYGLKIAFYSLLAVYFLIALVLTIPSVRNRPGMVRFHYRFFTLSRVAGWGLHKPLSFITNTFSSHIPRQKITRTISLMAGALLVVILVQFSVDSTRQSGRSSLLNQRHLHTALYDSLFVNPGAYDNQRVEEDYIDAATIQADVIRDPFIRLYVAYPKALDTLLTRLAAEPVRNTKLPIGEQRSQFARWSNQQLNRLVRIDVNDSLYRNPDLLFTRRGPARQRGWQTVLIPTNLRMGRNMIQISIQADTTKDADVLAIIPFWYVPEPSKQDGLTAQLHPAGTASFFANELTPEPRRYKPVQSAYRPEKRPRRPTTKPVDGTSLRLETAPHQ